MPSLNATSFPGSSRLAATTAAAPLMRRAVILTASSSDRPSAMWDSIRCGMHSLSVWDVNTWPWPWSSALSSAKFSTMPLCTTATSLRQSVCGCEFSYVGAPWVAHRVWPRPLEPSGRPLLTTPASADSLPTAFLSSGSPDGPTTTMPALS